MSVCLRIASTSALLLATLGSLGCGGNQSTTTAAAEAREIRGGGHALGSNPEAEAARIKKGAGAAKARPQQLPGR